MFAEMVCLGSALVIVGATSSRFRGELARFKRELVQLKENALDLRRIVEELQASNERFSKVLPAAKVRSETR
jgi:hypothetical protein